MNLYQACLLTFLLASPKAVAIPIQDVSDPGMPFQVTVRPAFVNRMTAQNMTLRCERNLKVGTKLEEIFRIRLVRQSPSGWDLVAEQRDLVAGPTVGGGVTALASITGDVQGVFLQASWKTIGDDSFGVFKCDVTGFDAMDDVVVESSSLFEVFEFKNFIHHLISISVETHEKVLEMKNFTDAEFARLNKRFQQLAVYFKTNQTVVDHNLTTIQTQLDSQKTQLNSLNTQLETLINGKIAKLENENLNLKDQVKSMEPYKTRLDNLNQWPGGYYALLRPKTGCPLDLAFFGGTHAYLSVHTESQSSSDPANIFSQDAFSYLTVYGSDNNNFVNLEFCETINSLNTNNWPDGSYCIHKLRGIACPPDFLKGYVLINTENTQFSGLGRNNIVSRPDDPYLYFCCKNSSKASDPIQLPTASPFLLYRYGGVCQEVQGMSVSEVYIQINTEDDHHYVFIRGEHPDVDQQGNSVFKFNLCHYQ